MGRKGYRRAEECATGSQCQSARATPPQPTIQPPRKGPGWKCMESWEGIGRNRSSAGVSHWGGWVLVGRAYALESYGVAGFGQERKFTESQSMSGPDLAFQRQAHYIFTEHYVLPVSLVYLLCCMWVCLETS